MAATVGPGRPSDASFLFHGVEEKTPLLGRGHRDDDGRTEEPKNPGFDREAFSRLLAIVKLLSRSRVIVAAYSALFILTAVTECVVYFVGMRISLFFQYLLLRNLEGFLANTGILLGAFMLLAVLKGCSRLSGGFFALEARRKLSEMLQVSLVSPDNLYRITKTQPFSTVVDNPDQRICQDVDKLTAQLRTVLEALVITPLTIAFYTFMVWRVGGWLGPAIIYLFYAISGLVSYGLMAPLVPLIFRKDRAEGDYRYLHVHVRDYSETISLEGGNLAEQNALDDALYRVLDVQRSVVWRDSILSAGLAVLASMGGILCYVIVAIPVLVTHEYDDVPADKLSQIISLQTFTCIYLSSKLTGILNQAQEITDLAGYANRLGTLWESMSNGDVGQQPDVVVEPALPVAHGSEQAQGVAPFISFSSVSIATPTIPPRTLIRDLTAAIAKRDRILLVGSNGRGKSSVVRLLAGIWTPAGGTVTMPDQSWSTAPRDSRPLLFVPQQPYLPFGSLRSLVTYPLPGTEELLPDDELESLLRSVGLGDLLDRTRVEYGGVDTAALPNTWERIMSPGERQRLGFSRLFFHLQSRRDGELPFVVMDESTGSIDSEMASRLMDDLSGYGTGWLRISHGEHLEPKGGEAIWRLGDGVVVV